MMKLPIFLFFALSYVTILYADRLQCTLKPANISVAWIDMVDPCVKVMENQVKVEINASITYLAMGAYFARDSVNQLGFSKLFFEAANEEREHSIKIIEYLLMRGQLINSVNNLLIFPLKPGREEWGSGAEALSEALDLEAKVTKSIRNIIRICESSKKIESNDYHLVDYLTGIFLDEQYKGQRDLAAKISILVKMKSGHGPLAEYLFDKKLLNGEL